MEYETLRSIFHDHPKIGVHIDRPPLVHEGFPGNFNMSVTEKPMLDHYGGYMNFNDIYNFSMMPVCIRINDFELMNNHNNYLGVFELSDLTGEINGPKSELPDVSVIVDHKVKSFIDVAKNILNLDINNIYPSVCAGGTVNELSGGKYSFNKEIPPDSLTEECWVRAGIPEKNIIHDNTRNTLLSLHINRPTPWGYRSEIHYKANDDTPLVDIGTMEHFVYEPIFDGEKIFQNIVGLKPINDTMIEEAYGLERINAIINGLSSVYENKHISTLYTYLEKHTARNPKSFESLRALHAIYSDKEKYGFTLGRHHNDKIRQILQNIPPLDENVILSALQMNAELQPWHEELSTGIHPTLDRIMDYRSRI